jgi:acyl-CoA thioesterase FadM
MLWHSLRVLRYIAKAAALQPALPSIVAPTSSRVYVGGRMAGGPRLHAHHSRYFELMEFARWETMVRCGMLRQVFTAGVVPIVSDVHVQFLRPLPCFQTVVVETAYVGMHNDRFALLEHTLVKTAAGGGERVVFATAVVKIAFSHKGRAASLSTVAALYGQAAEFAAVPNQTLAGKSALPAVAAAAGAVKPLVATLNVADDAYRAAVAARAR